MKMLSREAVLDAVPTSWLDPILIGPDSVIALPDSLTPRDIENVLKAVGERLAALPVIED